MSRTIIGLSKDTLPWIWPPKKWADKEWESEVVVSRIVRNAAYWVGTSILGMKEQYVEYSAPLRTKEKQMLVDF